MITSEIIEGLLDEGYDFLKSGRYAKAIECFDEILFFDPKCGKAMMGKSHSLYGEGHFVKALRYYKCAVKASEALKDVEYHKLLLKKSGEERDAFPKLKQLIYAGDEHFRSGEYEKALESYEKALTTPSKQKEKILFKLLNKEALTYLKLNDFESALVCFDESLNQLNNDCAWYGKGVCEYELKLGGACESLARAVKLTKEQLLDKGLILNELGCCPQALETFEFLLQNHYRQDEIYIKALNGLEFSKRELAK